MSNKKKQPILDKAYRTPMNTVAYDDITKQTIEFWPAGITKIAETGHNRQRYYKQIFQRANTTKDYPIGDDNHKVILVAEPENKVDPYAVKVYLIVKGSRFDLGWVPREISQQVATNLERINEGKVKEVTNTAYDEFYSCKLVFGYDKTHLRGRNEARRERIQGILGEINSSSQ